MAIVQNPLIGAAKQKIGNAVFSTWKGIYVLKTKPVSVANPQTDAQVQQRSAFAQMVAIFRSLPAVIRVGFKKLAVKQSEFNAFTSYNLKNAFDMSVAGVATLVPQDLLTSRGTIAIQLITSTVSDKSLGTIVANWDSSSLQPGQSAGDKAILTAYNETTDLWTGQVSTVSRSVDTASIAIPAAWNIGDSLTVFLGFYNPANSESSDSSAMADIIAS